MSSNNASLAAKCRTGADANTNDDCRVVAVVNSVQNFWTGYYKSNNRTYQAASTTIFSGATRTGRDAA